MAEDKLKQVESSSTENENEGIGIMDILSLCLSNWKWLVFSVFVCLAVAVLYIKRTPPTYQRTAAVLIKDDKQSIRRSSGVAELSELGGLGMQSNVYNEILTFKSPAIMSGVVKALGLEVDCYAEGFFYDKLLYGTTAPYRVQFLEMENDFLAGELQVDGESYQLKIKTLNKEKVEEVVKGDFLDSVKISNGGSIIVSRNSYYLPDTLDGKKEPTQFEIVKYKNNQAIENCLKNLGADLADKNADVINLAYTDVSIERATDVVNALIQVYNEKWLEEKNQITVSTSQFIDERLAVIEKELGSVDNSISSYKSANRIPDIELAADAYFTMSTEASDQLLDYNNRKAMANFVRQQLNSNIVKNQLLPANSGIENPSIEEQISEYNKNLLQRNNLAANSNEQNPLVMEFDETLSQMRKMIIASLDNYVHTLEGQINTLERKEERSVSQLTTSPDQAKYILSVERQQKVKESLYLFLLQKREENEIGQTFTAYNTRIINWAVGSERPVAPSKGKILLIAFALGLAFPIGVIYLKEMSNTTVRGRKDLENMAIPFIGEIPMAFIKKKERFVFLKELGARMSKKKQHMAEEKRQIVVKDRKRDFVNEAFRVVRTNLEFMLGHEGDKVVMTSSFNPGSGKTFLGMNIAVSYAIKGKKVVVVDLDLRKASLSTYVDNPKQGVAAYLNGDVKDYHEVIVSGTLREGLDVIPCGVLPPNPAELLYSLNLEKMIKSLREEYDYVFLDCPPVEMLADSTIINKYVDLTAFVVRAGLFERSLLPKLDEMYKDKRYKNMAIILNATDVIGGRYGKYGYGKYGYGKYGYGKYGYGYGNYGDAES